MAWSPCASAAAWAPPASSSASDSWFCRRRASALFASRRFLPGSPASFVLVAASFAIFRPGFDRESRHLFFLLLICSSRAFGGGHEICEDRVSDRRHLGRADHHTALLHVRSHRAERSPADHSSGILLRIRGRRSGFARAHARVGPGLCRYGFAAGRSVCHRLLQDTAPRCLIPQRQAGENLNRYCSLDLGTRTWTPPRTASRPALRKDR